MTDAEKIAALQIKVAELESKLNYVMQHLNLSGSGAAAVVPQGMEDVAEFVRQGKTMEAIKAYRAKTNTGLNEAKDAVSRLATQLGIRA